MTKNETWYKIFFFVSWVLYNMMKYVPIVLTILTIVTCQIYMTLYYLSINPFNIENCMCN